MFKGKKGYEEIKKEALTVIIISIIMLLVLIAIITTVIINGILNKGLQ